MRNRTNGRRSRGMIFLGVVAGALVLAGCGLLTKEMTQTSGTVTPLDELEWEGDTFKPPVVFLYVGPAAEGATVEEDIILYIERKKGGNEFEDAAEVTVTFDKAESDGGLKDHVTPESVTITLPTDWRAQDNGTLSAEIKFVLKFTIPAGFDFDKTYVLHFTATGPGYDKKGNKSSLKLEEIVQIKFYKGEKPQTYTLSGAKWDDKDADGVWDSGEPGIKGWAIYLYAGDVYPLKSTETDANGAYEFAGLLPGEYEVREELVQGWAQTYPAGGFHEVTIVDADITGINFGNVRTYSISGAKWYDRNKDGDWDTDEPAITGWKIELYAADGTTLLDSTFTGGTGYKFENLMPGTYVVKEGAVSGTWIQTFPTNPYHHTVTIVDEDITGVNFGNVCEVTSTGGYTLGFWSNRNGQTALTRCTGWATYLSNDYNLVNKAGSDFNPSATAYAAFRTWLLAADSVNMSYMLSVQLAATLLNIRCMGANYAGLGIVIEGTWTSIADVIVAANTFLLNNKITTASGPARTLAEFYKNVFDNLNNNRLKLIPYNPCRLPTW